MQTSDTWLAPSAAAPGSVPADGGVVRLAHWGLLRARGEEAAKFLHGQLTNDFSLLALGQARLAGFCSAKGRLQASFVGWKLAHDDLLLACHHSVLAATLKRLSMFVLRSKCKLSDEATSPAPRVCSGLVGGPALRALAATELRDAPAWQQRTVDAGSLIKLPESLGQARAVWVAEAGVPAPGALAEEAALPLDTWRWLEVSSGLPTIEAATVDQFVPQMLNYELLGGVDFQKGCYPGQEVVARSQYRGTVKRRMFLFDTDGQASAGQEVFHSADPGQPAGMVANAAPQPGGAGSRLLVELKFLSDLEQK